MGFIAIGAVVLFLAFVFLVPRLNEVCAISVREGRVLVVRGHAPQALVNDIAEVVRRANVREGMVRVVKDAGRATIDASGVDANTAQRLRNVLGAHPYRLLASAPLPPGARNLGQILGWAWLAWLLTGGAGGSGGPRGPEA